MNIVLVIDQFDNGNNGTTITARRYAEQLRRRGHRVTILAGGEAAEAGGIQAEKGRNVN